MKDNLHSIQVKAMFRQSDPQTSQSLKLPDAFHANCQKDTCLKLGNSFSQLGKLPDVYVY